MKDIANHKLTWGKYKGKSLKDIPDNYLEWILNNKPDIFKGRILLYLKTRFNHPKDKYQVTVKDSVGTDGIYIVEAYTKKQAMYECEKQYKIQNTQSFHGTEYDVIKL